MKQRAQMNMVSAVLILLAVMVATVSCGSTIIKVPPIKPGEVNQTIEINIPATVDVQRNVQVGNNTSARIVVGPAQQSAGGDCLLSDCDENDVACDGLPPCGPVCPADACSRVNCSQCWLAGFSGPCCWSCCSQYTRPVPYSQQSYSFPTQYQQAIPLPYPQAQPVPFSQPQLIPIARPQPIPYPLPQPIAVPRPLPIAIPQPQPIPVPQPNPVVFPVPVPQPQPIPFPQPRPVPYPVPVPQPYAVPQPQPVPVPYPQPQQMSVQQPASYPQPSTMPQSQCRPIPSWPFIQCPSLPPVQPQPPPCYWFQPGCYPQVPQYPNMCYTVGPC